MRVRSTSSEMDATESMPRCGSTEPTRQVTSVDLPLIAFGTCSPHHYAVRVHQVANHDEIFVKQMHNVVLSRTIARESDVGQTLTTRSRPRS